MTTKPRILCVDDEPQILEGLKANLYRKFDVVIATGGEAALALIAAMPTPPVAIVSDMRMPQMDGATFLARARTAAPDATRLLLTGHADMPSAISAVNNGQIFRFLTKPCPAPALIAALDAAVEQHRLLSAERVLLEQTLHGCVKTMTDILAITSPLAFGRATRIRRRVVGLLDQLAVKDRWQVDVAAMMSQLGAITLPADTAEKLYHGQLLSLDEQRMVARIPAVTEQLLGNIPRLEPVRAILAAWARPPGRHVADGSTTTRDAGILRMAVDVDALESQGHSAEAAVDILRERAEQFDPAHLDALAGLLGIRAREVVKSVALCNLQVGMVLVEDMVRDDGMLLLARGVEIAAGVIERIKNFRPGTVREPIQVSIRTETGGDLRRLARRTTMH